MRKNSLAQQAPPEQHPPITEDNGEDQSEGEKE